MKSTVKALLRRAGYDLVPHYRHLPTMWDGDRAFKSVLAEIESRTLVPPERLFALWQYARALAHKPGEMAEVGVYKGGTAKLLSRACPEKPLHLFDTFEGMPEVSAVDLHRAGDFADTSIDAVRAFLGNRPGLEVHPGLFPETGAAVADRRFALVYVDVDIYPSVLACLEFFYPRLTPGGAMLFDDYEARTCPGVRQAIDEFLADKPERAVVTARFQAAILKL